MRYKIGIICAGEGEIAPVLSYIEEQAISEKAKLKFYQGRAEGVEVVSLFCGVCKVNAAIATQILIDTYGCNIIINGGTAGGMDKGIDVFDTVVSTETAYWDVSAEILTEYHPKMDSIYFKTDGMLLSLAKRAAVQSRQNVIFGRTMTGERFIDQETRQEINENFSPLTVDMETAAIAHVCHVNQVPFIAIRTITDTEKESGVETFERNCDKASQQSADFVRNFLKELSVEEKEYGRP